MNSAATAIGKYVDFAISTPLAEYGDLAFRSTFRVRRTLGHLDKTNGTATYGDDAVAGVINIILKDTYNGGEFDNYIGFSQRLDATVYHSQFIAGLAEDLGRLGKLNILVAFNYEQDSPIEALDRPFTTGDYSRLAANY